MILQFDSRVQYIKGVGPRRADQLARLGIATAGDLLFHFPIRYEDRRNVKNIANLASGEVQTVSGVIESAREIRRGRRRMFEAVIKDESGKMRVIWFSVKGDYLSKKYRAGKKVIATGKVGYNAHAKSFDMAHPDIEVIGGKDDKDALEEGRDDKEGGGILPVYNLTEGVTQKTMRKIVGNILASDINIPEIIPQSVLQNQKLMPRNDAVRQIHFPDDKASVSELEDFSAPAHRRMIFEEFFIIECAMAIVRSRNTDRAKGVQVEIDGETARGIIAKLPFELTPDQINSLKEIVSDLKSEHPMNRLLQGEVGCGKTVVAGVALSLAARGGYQTAMMAPTEILAEQHYKSIDKMKDALGLRTALLTSGIKEKEEIKEKLKNGEIDLLVGTHAVIQEDVEFKNLGLAVIDEQHRFGVRQRAQLVSKGALPNTLIMTATPIPRTLAMTLYGDLDISTIKTMPKGRGEVETKVIKPNEMQKAHLMIHREIKKGRQAFIIYPLVEESEKMELKAATDMFEYHSKKIFPDLRVALMHGRMKGDEKAAVMHAFTKGDVDILISTTVIEVGIDQPNATVMMVEHSERFGLAQLHQLRGRIGRGSEKSYCL
ncbi:MAG: ATP-dependent DNA helicase RecG, partial [Nitrospinota bacterium]